MITVITPVHKNKYINNSIDNFLRQNYIDKELVLVFNGECLSYDVETVCNNIHVLKTKSNNISIIRNEALDWAQNNNRKIFSCFDSDDFYGSNYLTEAYNKLISGYKIVGKINYTAFSNEDEYKISGLVENGIIHGPTITGYVTNQRYNEDCNNLAEDIEYLSHFEKHEIGYTSQDNWKYSVQPDSIQNRSLNVFIESIKFNCTKTKNENCKIYKNNKLFWEYGDGYDLGVFSYHTNNDSLEILQRHQDLLLKAMS
jgi:hypothetical protein